MLLCGTNRLWMLLYTQPVTGAGNSYSFIFVRNMAKLNEGTVCSKGLLNPQSIGFQKYEKRDNNAAKNVYKINKLIENNNSS